MNKLLIALAWTLGAGPALAGGIAAAEDPGYTAYRRGVLGDVSVSAPAALSWARVGDSRVLGPYAQYLMYLGLSRSDALAQAERAGERASEADRTVIVERPQFDSYELYQRSVLGRSESEILRDRRSSLRRLAQAAGGDR